MCWKCGKSFIFLSPISRTEVCPVCDADVRSCKNCTHYALGSHFDCRESSADFIGDKERANFCDWFSLKNDANAFGNISVENKADDAKNQFNALFGD